MLLQCMASHAAISHLYQVLNLGIQQCFRLNCKNVYLYTSMHLYITGNDCVIDDGLSTRSSDVFKK